jgi:multimeric flavodoxin WrbA
LTMKLFVINGSPKGNAGNTNAVVGAFLRGAEEAGAVTACVFLSEKHIEPCRGCHACWSRGPGQCVIDDDMQDIISLAAGSDVMIFASPVYFDNISGLLKVFIDRLTMLGSPHSGKESEDNTCEIAEDTKVPGLMLISSCGYNDRSEFDVVSMWIRKMAIKMHMGFHGEICTTGGKYLSLPPGRLPPSVSDYLRIVEIAGKDTASGIGMQENTSMILEKANMAFAV